MQPVTQKKRRKKWQRISLYSFIVMTIIYLTELIDHRINNKSKVHLWFMLFLSKNARPNVREDPESNQSQFN